MKLLIITVVALVIPLFFVLVFVMSTVNKLASLRRRCLNIRDRADAQSTPEPRTWSEFNIAAEQYNAARRQFPTNLLATMWGFREMKPGEGQRAAGGQAEDGPTN